jgi:hypothetical protein
MKTAVMRAEGVPPEAPDGNRNQSTDSTDCTERLKAASSRRTLVKKVAASLAGTPHPGRRKWRNRPQGGRRLPVSGRSSSPKIIWVCFEKQTHMMAPAKLEKRRFPMETACFDVQRRGNQKAFFRKQSQMKQPCRSVARPLVTNDSRHGVTRLLFARSVKVWSKPVKAGQSENAKKIFDPIRVNPTRSDLIRPNPTA